MRRRWRSVRRELVKTLCTRSDNFQSDTTQDDALVLVRSMFEPAVTVWLTFEDGDTRLKHATVEFTFVPPEGKHRDCMTQTGDDGRCRVVTPPMSTLRHMRATVTHTTEGDNEVRKRGDIDVPKPLLEVEGQKPTIMVDVSKNKTTFASKVSNNGFFGADKCLLVDVSASMIRDGRLHVLRSSCVQVLEHLQRARANGESTRLALGAWDSHVQWCNDGRWIETPSEADFRWCRKLAATGGNNMRYAIEEAMRTFPDARDVFIMCRRGPVAVWA
jgi:hypothetical protein